MKYPKARELGEAIKALIKGPYTSRFPYEPCVPHPNFRGLPKFDPSRCVGCLACELVCPPEAIAHRDVIEETPDGRKHGKRILIHYTDTCVFCGQCEAACIADHEGIKSSSEWDLAFFDRSQAFETIEKELELCEICGEQLGLVDENIRSAMRDDDRSDRFKILCARCRRETTSSQEP